MTRRAPSHIVIVGGGVAAVETVAALRALAGPLPRITLLTPEPELAQRPASVGAPFGFGAPPGLPLDVVRRHARFDLYRGRLVAVDPAERAAVAEDGTRLSYDALVVAVGARPVPSLPGAVTFAGPADAPAVSEALEAAERVAFVMPSASGWALPAYELAIMAAIDGSAEITLVTAEPAPLWAFGPEAGEAVSQLLAARGITLRAGVRPTAVRAGALELADGTAIPADRVIALPRLVGPSISGLPHDDDGFIPVDAHGRVPGAGPVYAAGDATTFPVKQGGLAAQQADAAAEAIAAECGAALTPEPFRPVLRGLLLTGGAPLYLRSRLAAGGVAEPGERTARSLPGRRPSGEVSRRALWWPPGKVAGRYLAPLLATARPPVLAAAPLEDRPGPRPDDDSAEDALALTLLLAEEDAAVGDLTQALHALDAAAALTGGILPAAWERRRREWIAELGSAAPG